MPNWCENELTVTGNKAELEKFVAETFVTEEGKRIFDFDKVVPYPQKFKDMDAAIKDVPWEERLKRNMKDGFNSGGYEWCCANWGTKWGACNPTDLVETAKSIKQTFSTAWGPPLPVIAAASRKYPTLTFKIKYFEGGMGFSGKFVVKDDDVVENTENKAYRGRRGG